MNAWLARWRLDALNISLLAGLSFGLSAFLLAGNYLDTTYADWMYHAFRAQSFMQHGLVSWDSVWDNGISYWRAYQMVPGAITAGVAAVFHMSVPRAMIVLTVALYVLLHVGVYGAVRAFGGSRGAAFASSLLSFMFTGYWLIMKDYSISFAAVLVAPLLVIWQRSTVSRTRQLIFAALIGLGIYVHPLFALCFGGLWVFDKFIRRSNFSIGWSLLELLVMILPASFYIYGLVGLDVALVAPYQLGKDFIYSVAGAFRAGGIFTVIIPALLLIAIFMARWLSGAAKVLFWFTMVLTAVALLNLRTPHADALNRFQLTRTLFFIVIAYVVVFGEVLDSIGRQFKQIPRFAKGAAMAGLFGLAMGQTLADTSSFGANPVQQLPDPVAAFLTNHPGVRVDGGIYINGSTISSYNHPELRFANGYNDQLLPQLVNDRLNGLLKEDSPAVNIPAATTEVVRNYIQVLGVQYVFLPATSPFVAPLTATGFTEAGRLSGQGYRLVVLQAPGQPTYTALVSKQSAEALKADVLKNAKPGTVQYTKQLDATVARVAALQTTSTPVGSPAHLVFTAPDSLTLNLAAANTTQYVYVAQSHSRYWEVSQGSLGRTADGMMMLEVPAGITSVQLHHTWGKLPYIELGALTIVGVIIGGSAVVERRRRLLAKASSSNQEQAS